MLHASTSPFYPLFAALDVNAKIHEGESGRRLWAECVELGIESRKAILARCKLFRPFIPPVVDGKLWQDYPTSVSASDRRFFSFEPGAKWHGFEGYAADQYFVDRASCYSLHQVSMPKPANIATLAFRRRFWRTICVRTALCRRSAISTPFCSMNSGGKPREAGTTGGDAGAI